MVAGGTAHRRGSADGALLASWVYDTFDKGMLAAATRHAGGHAYTTRIPYRDNLYRPVRTSYTIPASGRVTCGVICVREPR